MRARLLLPLVLALTACSKPTPAPVSAAQAAFNTFVEAGCTAPDDAGAANLLEELASDAAPPWVSCLFEGGTAAACGLNCSADQ